MTGGQDETARAIGERAAADTAVGVDAAGRDDGCEFFRQQAIAALRSARRELDRAEVKWAEYLRRLEERRRAR